MWQDAIPALYLHQADDFRVLAQCLALGVDGCSFGLGAQFYRLRFCFSRLDLCVRLSLGAGRGDLASMRSRSRFCL